jgi:hypothetical protein
MRKLRLNLDALTVETFAPSLRDGMPGGTVRANDYTWDGGSCDTCVCETNEYSCTGGSGPGSRSSDALTCNDHTCLGMGVTCDRDQSSCTCIIPE